MTILVLCAYLMDAFGYTATKTALVYAQPLMCMTVRMLLGGTVLGLLTCCMYPAQLGRVQQAWWSHRWLWCKAIVFYSYIVYAGYYVGMRWLPSAHVALCYNVIPFIVAFLGYFLVDQKMTSKKWWGLVIGFIGIMPSIIEDMHVAAFSIQAAELLFLASVVSMAYGWFVVYNLMSLGYSPLVINSIGMLGAGMMALPTSLAIEGLSPERMAAAAELLSSYTASGIPTIVAFMGLIGVSIATTDIVYNNAIAYFMQSYSLVYLSFIGMVTPIMVALLNAVLIHEPLPKYFFLSFIMVAFGFTIFYGEELATQRKSIK